jgi:thymidine phosphorylase (EC 2.4.2.4)
MNPVEIIIKKRDGLELTDEELRFFINSYTAGKIPDYQASALLMAIFIRGLSPKETLTLTRTMLYSGTVIDLSHIPEPKIGKHSTGGVGDKTSLIIGPIALAAGVKVPQISGRGLGHTGGTLDKMESIPGFNTKLEIEEFKKIMKDPGGLIIGQTSNIAPADRLLYSLRDVVGAVPSIPLITASIMSKKLAEGTDGLVLDVKSGSGAFMQSYEDSKKLAESLKGTAEGFGKKCVALITEMSQPLGFKSGNWFEVHESIDILRGEYIEDMCEISFALSGAMIMLGGKAESIEEGVEISRKLVADGSAFDRFLAIIKAQGGDLDTVKYPERYPVSKIRETIYAENSRLCQRN